MANKAYNRGSAFERRIKRELEDEGCHVIKSGGSKGAVDLSATSPLGFQIWIQCKKDGKLSKAEYNKLLELGEKYDTTTIHVCKPKRNEPVKYEVIYKAGFESIGVPDWEEI